LIKAREYDLARVIRLALGVGIDEKVIKKIAKDINGFSGREIAKLMASVQGAVYGRGLPSSHFSAQPEPFLTPRHTLNTP
jgi:hypothetical protein